MKIDLRTIKADTTTQLRPVNFHMLMDTAIRRNTPVEHGEFVFHVASAAGRALDRHVMANRPMAMYWEFATS